MLGVQLLLHGVQVSLPDVQVNVDSYWLKALRIG